MTLQFALPSLQIKTEPSGIVAGYASVFGVRDGHGDVVERGAFHETLKGATPPAMLWQHRQDAPVGRWQSMSEDSRGLHVHGQLNMRTKAGQDAFEHLAAGDVNGLSIGFQIAKDGFRVENGTRVLTGIDLMEVSIVTLPSNPDARVTSVKSLPTKPNTLREFEAALTSLGYSRREATNLAKKGWASLNDESDELALVLQRITAASNF